MPDHRRDEVTALKDPIPVPLDLETPETWQRTGAAVLTEQGLYPEEEFEGDGAAEDFSAFDHLDACAKAKFAAAANHACRDA